MAEARNYAWLVETKSDSGAWYQCGYECHRTKKEALVEARRLGGSGPRRVTKYYRDPKAPTGRVARGAG